jgi:hypothetical protein
MPFHSLLFKLMPRISSSYAEVTTIWEQPVVTARCGRGGGCFQVRNVRQTANQL